LYGNARCGSVRTGRRGGERSVPAREGVHWLHMAGLVWLGQALHVGARRALAGVEILVCEGNARCGLAGGARSGVVRSSAAGNAGRDDFCCGMSRQGRQRRALWEKVRPGWLRSGKAGEAMPGMAK
jgi:hypothetical protein